MSRYLLAIDPGIRNMGLALFDGAGVLVLADLCRNPMKSGAGPVEAAAMARELTTFVKEADRQTTRDPSLDLVVEWPKVYKQGQLKGDPSDLLPLAAVNGAIAAIYYPSPVAFYLPRDWKGQIPKGELFNLRVMDRLSDVEQARIAPVPKSLIHNTYDAIGIGLHHLGRFKPKHVIAR